MAADPTPKLAGVIGWPVAHSLSPLIHTIWAKRAGVNGYYIPIAIEPGFNAFARAMDSLRTVGFRGVNVTLPHKEHALRYADAASDDARAAGAANMLTFAEKETRADNSDIEGLAAAAREKLKNTGGKVFVLGAGGAARGVSIALKHLGFSEILIANRTREKANALAREFAMKTADWSARDEAIGEADFIVNTTSLGMSGQPPLEIDLSRLKASVCVCDIVYSPLETPLLSSARKRNLTTVDGLAMLMHQAAPGFRAWFGADAIVDEDLRRHLTAELNRRSAYD